MAATAALSQIPWTRSAGLRAWRVVAAAGFAFLLAHLAFGLGGHALDGFVNTWLYDALELLAAAACLLRAAATGHERTAWAALGLGLLSFAVGDVCFDFVYGGNPPTPSIADGFYLAFYPCCYLALALLFRSRIASFSRSVWLDGVIAALAISAVSAAIVLEVVLQNTHGNVAVVVVDLTYPVADLVLLALVVFVFAVTGLRPGRAWAALGAGFVVITVADALFAYQNATGGYTEGTLLDALWPGALLLLAVSAWQPIGRRHELEFDGRFLMATPLVCGLVALGVLIDGRFRSDNVIADALAAGAIATVFARTGLSFVENGRLLARARAQSLTDHLTGLGNRRRLMVRLERELKGEHARPMLLAIFDLNGFKRYNDTFGHPSGDALLARIAGRLAAVVAPEGEAFRLGGDEFCILVPLSAGGQDVVIESALAALSEEGDGFRVSAEHGVALLPEEATDPSGALSVADERLYAQKNRLRAAQQEPHEMLLRALAEGQPGLFEHMRGVAALSVPVGVRLGLRGEELSKLRTAAELHDVGKLAIPDSVLHKPGTLSEEEWEFVRRHTVVGQRILAGAPTMREVGRIVRATHERWDGDGYVDGLAAASIPLAARIIAVCDAYEAMISDRPYRSALSSAEALAELRRCAGSQFDPEVVFAFCRLHDEISRPRRRPEIVRAAG